MPRRSLLALTVALVVTACNKPAPSPSAAAPENEAMDTVAAAGAPMADSTDSAATMPVDSATVPADSAMSGTTTN